MPLPSHEPKSKICGSHVLFNPEAHQLSEEKLEPVVNSVLEKVKQDPAKFGLLAFQASDCPSGTMNPQLADCATKVAKDDKDHDNKLLACIQQESGKLGCFEPQTMVPEFSIALNKLKVGEIAKVKTKFGYHLIRRDAEPSAAPKK